MNTTCVLQTEASKARKMNHQADLFGSRSSKMARSDRYLVALERYLAQRNLLEILQAAKEICLMIQLVDNDYHGGARM